MKKREQPQLEFRFDAKTEQAAGQVGGRVIRLDAGRKKIERRTEAALYESIISRAAHLLHHSASSTDKKRK